MGMQDFNIAFVVWRESIEALLVIGILNAWIGHRPEAERRRGRAFLWAGVGAGVVGAVALAAALIAVGEELSDDAQVWFQTTIVLIAAALIVQMVFWMRRHGRTLKRELHTKLDEAADRSNWAAVFVLAAIAVMREGSEAAVFLYGTMVSSGTSLVRSIVAAALGLALAFATYGMLQVGSAVRLVARVLPRHRDHAAPARGCAPAHRRRQSRFARRRPATFGPDMGHAPGSDGRGRARRPGVGPDGLSGQARPHSASGARGLLDRDDMAAPASELPLGLSAFPARGLGSRRSASGCATISARAPDPVGRDRGLRGAPDRPRPRAGADADLAHLVGHRPLRPVRLLGRLVAVRPDQHGPDRADVVRRLLPRGRADGDGQRAGPRDGRRRTG